MGPSDLNGSDQQRSDVYVRNPDQLLRATEMPVYLLDRAVIYEQLRARGLSLDEIRFLWDPVALSE